MTIHAECHFGVFGCWMMRETIIQQTFSIEPNKNERNRKRMRKMAIKNFVFFIKGKLKMMTHLIESTDSIFITELKHKFAFKIHNSLDVGHDTQYSVYLLFPK